MSGVAVAQRMSADSLPWRDRAQFLSAFHRRLHPAPCGRGMRFDDSALADVPIGEGAAQSAVQAPDAPARHKLAPCMRVIDRVPESDLKLPKQQQYTA